MVVAVRDPVFLTQRGRAVDNKLVLGVVKGNSGLDRDRIVSEAELSEAEASDYIKRVDLIEEPFVSVIMEGEAGATKEVELDGELDRS